MNFNRCTCDPNPVPITYTYSELDTIISKFISDSKIEFNFNELCFFIVNKAKEENKVKDSEHVVYSSSELSSSDSIHVSRILWDYIWNKEIFIAFGDSKYRSCTQGNTRFFKTSIIKDI